MKRLIASILLVASCATAPKSEKPDLPPGHEYVKICAYAPYEVGEGEILLPVDAATGQVLAPPLREVKCVYKTAPTPAEQQRQQEAEAKAQKAKAEQRRKAAEQEA